MIYSQDKDCQESPDSLDSQASQDSPESLDDRDSLDLFL